MAYTVSRRTERYIYIYLCRSRIGKSPIYTIFRDYGNIAITAGGPSHVCPLLRAVYSFISKNAIMSRSFSGNWGGLAINLPLDNGKVHVIYTNSVNGTDSKFGIMS